MDVRMAWIAWETTRTRVDSIGKQLELEWKLQDSDMLAGRHGTSNPDRNQIQNNNAVLIQIQNNNTVLNRTYTVKKN